MSIHGVRYLLAMLAITAASAAEGPPWKPVGDLTTGRWGHTATLLPDGRVLVAGGREASAGAAERSVESYHPGTASWSYAGEMISARVSHTATLLPDGRVLVVGGDASGLPEEETTAEIFDPANGAWAATGSLNTPRVAFTATLLQTGEVLVVGGVDRWDQTVRSAELYDPRTGTWSFTGNLVEARFFHTATLLADGRVLVVAGVADDFFGTQLSSAELYDPVTRTWKRAGYVDKARSMHTATLLPDGRVLVAGGNHRGGAMGSFGIYHYTEITLAGSEIFEPLTGHWIAARGLATPRAGHTSTLLRDGDLLVAGGARMVRQIPNFATEPLRSAELFDTDDLAWLDAMPLVAVRAGHTATLLRDGSVLVVGGLADGAGSLRSAELYRPASSCDKNHFILDFPCTTDIGGRTTP